MDIPTANSELLSLPDQFITQIPATSSPSIAKTKKPGCLQKPARRRLRPAETRATLSRRLEHTKIAVLFSQSEPLQRGDPMEILSDDETSWVAGKVARALKRYGLNVQLNPVRNDLDVVLARLDPKKHLIFNLCESLGGRSFSEADAAARIAHHGFVFTGADPETIALTMDKVKTKRLLLRNGLPTPAFQFVRDSNRHRLHVQLPAIVKPSVESGSMGINQQSLAHDPTALWDRVESCLQTYRQPVLIEDYIPGREINVAIWGADEPEILPLYEIDFQWTSDPFQRIVSFDSKWVKESVEYSGTPGICPARLSSREENSIREVALHAYELLGIRSYARIDIRLFEGIPYILEVNANPDLAPNAGFFHTAKAAGFSYPQMVRRITQLALELQP